MLEFQLFKIQVFPPKQGTLFEKQKHDPIKLLKEALLANPEAESKRGRLWHIGNVTPIDENAFYFRIGRIVKGTIEVFKEGKFADQEFEAAPYTHAVIDIPLELCAIARKAKLAPYTRGIANQLERLLAMHIENGHDGPSIDIKEIKDPEDFIAQLKKATVISKFWITIAQPNAFDAQEQFEKPLRKLLQESAGDSGKLEIKGQLLKEPVLEELARSAASTGRDAGAVLQPHAKSRKVRKKLSANPVNVQETDVESPDKRKHLLERIRTIYHRIRQFKI